MKLKHFDSRMISFFNRAFIPLARLAFFVVFFWFGFIKLVGASPASPLAEALVAKTVGIEWFDILFITLALMECLIGVLFLIPRAVRLTILLLFVHILIVSSPLLLLPGYTWESFLIPTLEGQYIIKNIVVIALAFGIAANTKPLKLPKL
ncbi:hypothetical protein KY385_00475 [Candidatus Parcubacteria bacterium]|nr:hypothetical protein [Candidatus Parcubacteria bacterium]